MSIRSMKRAVARSLSPVTAVIVLALIAATAGIAAAGRGLTGGSRAGRSTAAATPFITGQHVLDGSITGADVADHTLTPNDFSGSVKGPPGPPGPPGPRGVPGPSNTIVRTHDAAVGLPAATTNQTVVTMSNIPAGSYLLTAKTVAVNFSASDDFVRCAIAVGATQIDASTTRAGGSADAAEVAALPMMGGYASATPFTAILRCWHDTGSIAGIYMESSRLIATAVGSLDVAGG
jgi:hypothetical protein